MSGLKKVSDITPVEVEWLWHHRIPRGMLSEICGDPDVGKSSLTRAIATALSLGKRLPGDLVGGDRPPENVLLICTEDHPGATVRPKIEAMGADMERVWVLEDGIAPINGAEQPLMLTNHEHRMWLEEAMVERAIAWVVVDPISAHIGGVDEFRDGEMRSMVLSHLSGLVRRTNAAMTFIRHLNKDNSKKAIYRPGGSIAMTGVVRSSLMVGKPNEYSDERVVAKLKGNLSPPFPSVSYEFSGESGKLKWLGISGYSASQIINTKEESPEMEKALEFLAAQLSDGERWKSTLEALAKEDGITSRTLERAKVKLGVQHKRMGSDTGAPTMWFLEGVSSNGDTHP